MSLYVCLQVYYVFYISQKELYYLIMITVNFFTTLRIFVNTKQVKLPAANLTVIELLQKCEQHLSKRFVHKLLTPDGQIIAGTLVLVNGQHIAHLDGTQTLVKDGDEVALFPPGGGG